MFQRKIDNTEAFFALSWIISDADKGFYIVVAPSHMQKDIAKRYKTQMVGVYDFYQVNDGYSYAKLNTWVDSQPEGTDILFLVNMQIALRDKEAMAALNMSRDLLAKKKKIWIFFMDKDLEYQLSTFAYDFYAYVRQKIYFDAELDEEFDGKQILEFDGRYNVLQIQETLKRSKDLEDRYMSLPIEETATNQLLSAAMALTNIAKLYIDCAEYDNALGLLMKVKEIREWVLELDHPDIAETYNDIAIIYNRKGEYSKALEWYQQALDITKKMLGKEHPDTAVIYCNIAQVYIMQGDYDKAHELLQEALDISIKMLGKDHPDTANTYSLIAAVYARQGDYNKALELHQQTLDIREQVLDKDHPLIASTHNNIAIVYDRQGNYSKALELHQKVLDIRDNTLGQEHPSTAITYNNIAHVYRNQGDYNKALEFFQKAYAIRLRKLGENHPSTKNTADGIQYVNALISKNQNPS